MSSVYLENQLLQRMLHHPHRRDRAGPSRNEPELVGELRSEV
jgi:hypothetical protein